MSSESTDAKELTELLKLPYSVATQSKIAKLLNKGGDPAHNLAAEENFEAAMMFLFLISSKIKGRPMPLNHSLASAVLGKICVTAMSIQELFRGHEAGRLKFLDHSSIAILCRAIIEASVMYWYLMENVGGEEWQFRLQVMKIHDAASCVRLFKPMIAETADRQRSKLETLRNELDKMPLFQKREEKQRIRLRGGELIYVNGMRSVVGAMNFDEGYYDSVYNYLSAHVHSTPISYVNDTDDFEQIFWQRTFSQYALHHAWILMIRVGLREVQVSGLKDQFNADLLTEFCRIAVKKIGASDQAPDSQPSP
jgi:hypothetical protein